MYNEKFIIVMLLESRWQIVLSIGQAVGKKNCYYAVSQGSFDQHGLDGIDNYFSLFLRWKHLAIKPVAFLHRRGKKARVDGEADLIL